jgi:hypothetical protein
MREPSVSVATREVYAASAAGSPRQAVEGAVEALGRRPGGVLAFVAEEAELLRAATETAARVAPGVPVAGMTGSGVMTPDGPLLEGCVAIAFDARIGIGVGVGHHASADPRSAGGSAARAALAQVEREDGHPVLLLFVDPDAGDQSDIIAGAYEVVGGRVPLAGGAPSGTRPVAGNGVHTDAVVAVALVSPMPIGVGIAHGCRTCAPPAIVTRADGRAVVQLNGRPAVDVYLEKVGQGGERLSELEFERIAVTHPLAQRELSGDVRLRYVRGRTPDGALICATTIPEYAAVEVSEETPPDVLDSASVAARDAVDQLDGAVPAAAVVFDCASRRLIGGEELAQLEVDALASSVGAPGAAFAGVYTRGEIGRVRGAKGDRNHSLVVVAFG